MENPLLIQPNSILRKIYPRAIWNYEREHKTIYLTFDDGPIPELTEWILAELAKYNAKATFFCVGANILKNNQIFEKVKTAGHTVANHTMQHIKGFNTKLEDYINEVEECSQLVKNKLFRPPYGQIKRTQYKALINKGYNIIMWDVISYDYEKIEPKHCALKVLRNTQAGSIVLFHDNVKAEKNMKYSLPIVLRYFSEKGYSFNAIRP